jgi:general secretion pathway protein B
MSYILDALKKMEHEKARKARKSGMARISGDLFRDARPQSDRGGLGKAAALVVVTSLVAIGATWFFLRPSDKRGPVKPPPLSAPAAPVAVAPPPPPAVQPVPPAISLPPVAPQAAPAKPQRPAPGRVAPRTAASIPQDSDREPQEQRRARRRQPVAPPAEALPAATEAGVSADIRVSGIAWQDERRARRAVVNGFLMKEGGVVAGAQIVEILPDRVRFSQDGREFELSLVVSGSGTPVK